MNYAFFILLIILLSFVARVFLQVIVAIYAPKQLPPMEDWYSGRMSYPYLLLSQIFIIQLLTLMFYDFYNQSGLFYLEDMVYKKFYYYFSISYFSFMIFRYCHTMITRPERRWLKKTIPIWFHLLLASFIFIWKQ